MQRMVQYNSEMQGLKLLGTNNEYFDCNVKRMRNVATVLDKVSKKDAFEFFDVDRCNLDSKN